MGDRFPDRPLRIALLTYRGNPYSGGQGVYIRHLSRELTALGHYVEVFSGQPYPLLDDGVPLTRLPSLDLWREPDPFRLPRPSEFNGWLDVAELLMTWTAAFPEPLTFSIRAHRHLSQRLSEFDIVHDNQSLGYGLLRLQKAGLPVVATIHHPIAVDRRLGLSAARGLRRITLRRWYTFVRMQRRVAPRLTGLATVSPLSQRDIAVDLGLQQDALTVIDLGVDASVFKPTGPRVPGRIVTTASADVPLKGLVQLLEATAKARTERDVELVIVGETRRGSRAARTIDRLGLGDCVRFVSKISEPALVDLLGSAEVAVVPSLYEGFSLPAIEAMACATPLVATRVGALPELVGPEERAGLLVEPNDVDALALAIGQLLDDSAQREAMGDAARRRVLDRFTWRATASRTAQWYAETLARLGKAPGC